MIENFDSETKDFVNEILKDFLNDEKVLMMKKFIQHGDISTYDHSLAVAYKSYDIAKKLKCRVNMKTLIISAFLHDFYLYDWHDPDPSHAWHGFHHAKKAAENAVRYFQINEHEKDIIMSHMWPLNFTRVPKTREAWIVTFADKCVATKETFLGMVKKKK